MSHDIQTITLTTWYSGECPVDPDSDVIARWSCDGSLEVDKAKAFPWKDTTLDAYAAIRTEVAAPRVDRSARGLVVVGCENGPQTYRDARDDGLYDGYHRVLTWNECQNLGYTVRRLTADDLEAQDE